MPRQPKHPVADNVAFEPGTAFGSVDGRALRADLFRPKTAPPEPRPAMVALHGGAWREGHPSQFHHHCAHLARRHRMVCLSVAYRLSGEAKFPAALQDAKCAIRWLRANAARLHVDPEQIAVMGGSAGAHLASMVATTAAVREYEGNGGDPAQPSHANAVVLLNGEFDLWDLVKKKQLLDAMTAFIGGTPEELPDKYDELSSIQRIHRGCPPTLLLHGTADRIVSHEQSVAFATLLRKAGVHAELELYEGKPHGWFNGKHRREVLERIERFLVEQFELQRVGPAEDAGGAAAPGSSSAR